MWEEVLIAALGLVALGFGVYWRIARQVIKRAGELLATVADAMEDGQLTKEEIASVIDQARDILKDLGDGES